MPIVLLDSSGAIDHFLGTVVSVHANHLDASKAELALKNLSYKCGANLKARIVAVRNEMAAGARVTSEDLA
jgi:hypothetical protein